MDVKGVRAVQVAVVVAVGMATTSLRVVEVAVMLGPLLSRLLLLLRRSRWRDVPPHPLAICAHTQSPRQLLLSRTCNHGGTSQGCSRRMESHCLSGRRPLAAACGCARVC